MNQLQVRLEQTSIDVATFRQKVLAALIQVRYDRTPDRRDDPILVKEIRKYLPFGDSLSKFDLLNAMRFLRNHKIIIRKENYGWEPMYTEDALDKICFEHGEYKPCKKCERSANA